MSKRLEILKNSLEKKKKSFDDKLKNHFETVKESNGQPLNDKRNGASTKKRWEQQNEALRKLQESIKLTENAIEKEEYKIVEVNAINLPIEIKELIDKGILKQWRKHPTYFFVEGVERARIILQKNGTIAYKYVNNIDNKEHHKIFAQVYNNLAKLLNK